jgi:hypothetical protein
MKIGRRVAYVLTAVSFVVGAATALGGIANGGNRVVRFGDLPKGWVKGIPRDVRPASRIVGRLGGHTVAVAPTRNGNFCEAFWAKGRSSWSGCRVRGPFPHSGGFQGYLIGATTNTTATRVLAVSGDTTAGPSARLYLVYADRSREHLAVTWVTSPIRAGFFYRTIPKGRASKARRAKSLDLFDGARLIARVRLPLPGRR